MVNSLGLRVGTASGILSQLSWYLPRQDFCHSTPFTIICYYNSKSPVEPFVLGSKELVSCFFATGLT